MALELRQSSTTAGGTANATSLGGRPAGSAPSETKHAFFDAITSTQNDSGYTDYRCLFVYNSGSNVVNGVKVEVSNAGGGATGTVALASEATAAFASYTAAVIGSKTTAPSVSGSYGSSVTIGTLNAGQVKAVWVKRVVIAKAAATTGDIIRVTASGSEVIPL